MNVNDLNDARRGASPRARRGTRLVPAALLLLAPVMGACDGDNLFNGGAEDYVPVASVSAPAFASAGETISVRVGKPRSSIAARVSSRRRLISAIHGPSRIAAMCLWAARILGSRAMASIRSK